MSDRIATVFEEDPDEGAFGIGKSGTTSPKSDRRADWREWFDGGHIRRLSAPHVSSSGPGKLGHAIKRGFDIAVAATILVVFSPVILLIAALVRLDGGPVLFRHKRVGLYGRRFECMKFRTMVVGADRALQDLLARDAAAAAEWEQTQKLRQDPRITTIGRYLRASSLDELPQLFNILRGDMSLVGPRPIVDTEMSRYGDRIGHYLSTRPGLTGPWQISGRSDTTYASRVALDTHYVDNRSFWMDIGILFRTIPAVAMRRGAV